MTTKLRGASLLRDPRLNKSLAFPEGERDVLGLVGLLPEAIDGEDIQVQRILGQLADKPSNLEK
jgi:malate dehydrogenase (oxaloacetate-decarboxylating)(NADP+)